MNSAGQNDQTPITKCKIDNQLILIQRLTSKKGMKNKILKVGEKGDFAPCSSSISSHNNSTKEDNSLRNQQEVIARYIFRNSSKHESKRRINVRCLSPCMAFSTGKGPWDGLFSYSSTSSLVCAPPSPPLAGACFLCFLLFDFLAFIRRFFSLASTQV